MVESPSQSGAISFGPTIDRLLRLFKVDFVADPAQPSWVRLLVATVVSLAGSLGADAILVALGTRVDVYKRQQFRLLRRTFAQQWPSPSGK